MQQATVTSCCRPFSSAVLKIRRSCTGDLSHLTISLRFLLNRFCKKVFAHSLHRGTKRLAAARQVKTTGLPSCPKHSSCLISYQTVVAWKFGVPNHFLASNGSRRHQSCSVPLVWFAHFSNRLAFVLLRVSTCSLRSVMITKNTKAQGIRFSPSTPRTANLMLLLKLWLGKK